MKANQLKYFVATADTGSMKRAAESLNMNHSTLSQSITALEKELGLQLITRTNKGIALTPAGKQAHPIAKRIVDQMDELEHFVAPAQERDRIALLSLSPTLSSIISQVNLTFLQDYPHVQITYQEYYSPLSARKLEQKIESDDIDLVLCNFEFETGGRLQNELLLSSPYVYCVSKEHPLTARKKLRAEDCTPNYPLIQFSEMQGKKTGVENDIPCETMYNLATIKRALSDNRHIALLPKFHVEHTPEQFNKLSIIPSVDSLAPMRYFVLHRAYRTATQQKYLEYLRDAGARFSSKT